MKVAFLISRQERAVTADTWWIRAVHAAARWAAGQGWTLVGSGGILPIEFVRWSYEFHGGSVEILDAVLKRSGNQRRAAMRDRDRRACAAADVLVAVSVRAGGIMEEEGLAALKLGKTLWAIRAPDQTRMFGGNRTLLKAGAKELELPEIEDDPTLLRRHTSLRDVVLGNGTDCTCFRGDAELQDRWIECPTPRNYLWHFTRSQPGPWPGQSMRDYFQSLIDHADDAAHTGLDALLRILQLATIYASNQAIRGHFPVVCFTVERPEVLLPKRRFLSARARWDFQPYSVGFPMSFLQGMGARPVQYLSSREFQKMPACEQPFFQKSEAAAADWTHEKEWRLMGNFCFSRLPVSDWRCLVPSRDVETFLKRVSGRNPKG